MPRPSRWAWALLNLFAFATALLLNGLANALPLNGRTTGALSSLYPNLFVPMGATFAIWGVIYSGLLASVVYGGVLARSERARTPLEAIGPWLAVNLLANAGWIVAWHWQQVPLSVGLMAVILGTLILLYRRLQVGSGAPAAADRWLVHAPLSVYLGWISVATIANLTALAVDLGAPSFGTGPARLTVVMLAAAVLLACVMLGRHRDRLFTIVVMWALLGIHLKRTSSEDAGSEEVATASLVGLGLLGAGLLLSTLLRSPRTSHPSSPAA